MLENHPREQLCFIIIQYGRTIIDDPRRCRGLLKDLAPNHKRETNLLFQALEEKIVAELAQKNTIIPLSLQLDRLAQRLHDNCGIQLEFAYWSVESWAIALNIIQQQLPKQQDLTTDPYPEAVKYYEQKKYNEAFPLFKQVAEQGNANGQYHLGRMYRYGRGVEQDDIQAISWFRKAADQGLADGQFHLSVMYRDGCGVVQDDKQAMAWYRKAADQGHAAGQYHLGWMYKYGRGVEQDDKHAIFWYRKAANQGHADAIKSLGEELAAEQSKSVTFKLGDILPDGGIVFHVDASGSHGLAAMATDEPRELNWDKAITAASAYGSGWHLPTKDELNLLYQQVNIVSGFANNYYWSSTGFDANHAWTQYFGNGRQDHSNKGFQFPVRAVRAFPKVAKTSAPIKPPPKVTPIVKQIDITAYKLGDVLSDGSIVFHIDASGSQGLAAKATDESMELTWKGAITAANAYGSGWHLPTTDELNLLYQQKTVVGGFANNYYWSSTESGSGMALYQYFYNGSQDTTNKLYTNKVRAVRAI